MSAHLKEGIRAASFMFVLTLVLITCVSALHLATAERVRRNADLLLQRAVMEVAGLPVPARPAEVAAWFGQSVAAEPAGSTTSFRVRDGASDKTLAWAFVCGGRGLWGPITAVVGVTPDRRAFRELRILDQNETPGLGARIAEAWFMRQTQGKSGPLTLVPEGTRSQAPTEIDAITGATVSSAAVRDMLNGVWRDQGMGSAGQQAGRAAGETAPVREESHGS